jgi:hypothetical protein
LTAPGAPSKLGSPPLRSAIAWIVAASNSVAEISRERSAAAASSTPRRAGSTIAGQSSLAAARGYDRRAVARALVIVDIQNDYFPGGAHPLHEPEAAAASAHSLLERFRAGGEPVVHIQHVWDGPDAPFMRPGTAGVEIYETLAPLAGETLIQKAAPNAFLRTSLESVLREAVSASWWSAG